LLVGLWALSLTACSSARILPEGAEPVLVHGDARVGTYVSSLRGFETSSYWIEGPAGLVLVDTQFLLSAGDEAVAWAEKATGKKVVLAVVLHPNPDKFNGTNRLKARGIPVVTSEQVRALIPEVHKDRHYWFYDRFKPDYPDELPLPDSFGARTRALDGAGLQGLVAHVLSGPGCSGAHVALEWQGHLFVGDLVANLNHSWLEIGEIDEWIKRMDELLALKPRFVHPGRGPSGGPELLEREKDYLNRVKRYVLAEHPREDAPDSARKSALARVRAKVVSDFPGYGQDYFLTIGLPAVWAHYAD
jgi:glyoxylase-like metal-dependent hydrolase (beta-lactamase superfamily II)